MTGRETMAGRLSDLLGSRLLPRLLRYTNRVSDTYTTICKRPKFADHVSSWADPDVNHARVAIVMQGPIATDGDFTLETLKLYVRHMPGCDLILSTWKDTPAEQLDPIRQLGVRVALSDKPAMPGLFNVNMQLTSAGNGVRAAVENGAEWILKTRTDQRLGDRNAMVFLRSLAEAFPPAQNTGQRARIVGIGHGSLKFAPYHVTDQTVFGHAEDMLVYWTAPLREDTAPRHWPERLPEIFSQLPLGELCRFGAAESYICSRFLEAKGCRLTWTLADTWAAYRDRFCLIDQAMVDFFWMKEQTASLREGPRRHDMISNRYEMGFGEWLLLYTGQVPAVAATRYEHVLLQRFNEPVTAPG